MKTLRVCMAQINTAVGDFPGNQKKIAAALSFARSKKTDFVVFPELTVTGYPPEDLLFKKSFIAANLKTLRSILPFTANLCAIVGFVDKDASDNIYNAAAVLQNKKLVGVYRKARLPNYGVFDEKRYFAAGKEGVVLQLDDFRIGVTICEDIWQRDTCVYRKDYRNAVSLIVNLSASPYHRAKYRDRERLVRQLAVRNRCAVLYENLVGGQDELVFDGGSLLVDGSGKRVARCESFEEDLRIVDIPLRTFPAGRLPAGVRLLRGAVLQKHSLPPAYLKALPLARERAPEEEVYRALVLGTRDYVRKNGFEKVLIGLSGGIDSALVACVAADALGSDNVIGVTMPSPYTSRETLGDARLVAKNLGIRLHELPIQDIFSSYLASLEEVFAGQAANIAEENLQARIRGNLLMALSNKFGYLVLTTGNKSEMATGYCTLYGDMAGGFAVIKDVPKTLVFKLSRYRNAAGSGNLIPESTLTRPPTAELRPNQTDQDTLPPYVVLDRFLERYVEKETDVPGKLATKLARMVDKSEYKRRQSPLGIKITPRAFGRDRRMPVTNCFIP